MPIRSPWLDLANEFNTSGAAFTNALQRQAALDRQERADFARLFISAIEAKARQAEHEARTKKLETETAEDAERMRLAQALGDIEWAGVMPTLDEESVTPGLLPARRMQVGAALAALGNKVNPYDVPVTSANASWRSPWTGTTDFGPIVLSPGSSYRRSMEEAPVISPRPYTQPPGYAMVDPTGKTVTPPTPFRPPTTTSNPISAWNRAIASLTGGYEIDDPLLKGILMNVATNLPPGVGNLKQPSQGGKGRPTKSLAAEYVRKYGSREAAREALISEGYDVTGYAN